METLSWASSSGRFGACSPRTQPRSDDPERCRCRREHPPPDTPRARRSICSRRSSSTSSRGPIAWRLRAVLSNQEAVIADALNTEPRTQTKLKRLDEEDRPLRRAHSGGVPPLLGVDDHDDDYEHAGDMPWSPRRRVGFAYLRAATRGAPAASALRCSLMGIAAQAEMYAWTASGGML